MQGFIPSGQTVQLSQAVSQGSGSKSLSQSVGPQCPVSGSIEFSSCKLQTLLGRILADSALQLCQSVMSRFFTKHS